MALIVGPTHKQCLQHITALIVGPTHKQNKDMEVVINEWYGFVTVEPVISADCFYFLKIILVLEKSIIYESIGADSPLFYPSFRLHRLQWSYT